MPNYNKLVSDDTPCLELPADQIEKRWLWMHRGCKLRLVMVDGEILLEDLTHDVFLIGTEETIWGEDE